MKNSIVYKKFENLSKLMNSWQKESLICPNCLRLMPNLRFKRNGGCLWCLIPKKR
jgi:hypothetical protein